tara:strand:- start:1430 stop:1774 length:345 start_codon:yes stop_codon:yes gene_type:complete
MNEAITNLLEEIKNDYLQWTQRSAYARGREELTEINHKMIAEFNEGLHFEEGRKYIKVITGGSVWGFVMKEDDTKFKAGDILKAAGWAAPARNKARGNVFNDLTWVNWTGPAYL